ncbi:hypothetical protein EHO58_19020 [Leptospira selangorensis]|nr:hypothetical protein EHO58_19020 [Leptospira selangorensis]
MKYALILLLTIPFNLHSTEILFRNGDAFIAEDVSESGSYVFISWQDRKYRIPKSDLLRIDKNKVGPESSYRYSEFELTDGSIVRGILVEKQSSKLIIKTELGFAELDLTKIRRQEINETSPTIPDRYLMDVQSHDGNWRGGLSISGTASFGPWSNIFPLIYGGGGFVERVSNTQYSFLGFSSDYQYAPGKNGNMTMWSQNFYYGKTFSASSPYFLIGFGASYISWQDGDRSRAGIDPDGVFEFGWNWETKNRTIFRTGIRSVCSFEGQDSLCRSGIRFSLGAFF